ncbi:MAG: UDP-N-acetylglucosamine 4,6-dehydratase (inverting) [Candidatus Binatia bacterium]|nr:UDP-N-acetylglucosamine 4,6-dehydratase (inverting) [Candidatus Binatia bacterium]
MEWQAQTVLITGGTGSFGRKFIDLLLRRYRPKKLIVLSRDELKQHEMRQLYPDTNDSPMRYFIGDVRDKERLQRAFQGVDVVIHAAALKQVPTAEYNPLEVIKTNVLGAANVIDVAIDCGVKRVIALSSDKAVHPINLYGATKLCADKLFIAAGVYAGARDTRFSVVRYGNVVGSRGSVIPLFLEQRATGVLSITDPRMTRFWITLEQAVLFVIRCLELMQGGEIFVPKLPSMRVVDLARAIAPECRQQIVGIRPGEKLHETLLTEEEARHTLEFEDFFVVQPGSFLRWWNNRHLNGGRPLPEGFRYSSETNDQWLSVHELRHMVEGNVPEPASLWATIA